MEQSAKILSAGQKKPTQKPAKINQKQIKNETYILTNMLFCDKIKEKGMFNHPQNGADNANHQYYEDQNQA